MVSWVFTELDDTGSTQAVAKGLAAMDAPEGTTVVAKSQTSGMFRYGRGWASPIGGLYMSFVLRPRNMPQLEVATLTAAAAVVDGVKAATDLASKVKWPNDVVVGDRKLASTMAEAQTIRKEIASVVVGLALNCNNLMNGIAESKGTATSLVEELGKEFEISDLKHSILDAFSGLYSRWQAGEDMVPVWKEHVGTIGKTVAIKTKTEETTFSFQALGVDSEGGLILFREGETRVLQADDLEWLKEEPSPAPS